jgi:thiamine pyrophosphate-dependent acetolactate synthase large subunit-like protein
VAEALGGYAERVDKVDDLRQALERAIKQTQLGTPVFLEIITADEPIFPGG